MKINSHLRALLPVSLIGMEMFACSTDKQAASGAPSRQTDAAAPKPHVESTEPTSTAVAPTDSASETNSVSATVSATFNAVTSAAAVIEAPDAGPAIAPVDDSGSPSADNDPDSAAAESNCEDLPEESLITNGGFEAPVVPVGGYTVFATGSEFSAWSVIGQGNVAPLSGSYRGGSEIFQAHAGMQTMDLTGIATQKSGIAQAVNTLPGERYCIAFWSGNARSWGPESVVEVLLDGNSLLTSVNAEVATGALAWVRYSVTFTAASTSSTLAFMNQDSDNSNVIDSVVLKHISR